MFHRSKCKWWPFSFLGEQTLKNLQSFALQQAVYQYSQPNKVWIQHKIQNPGACTFVSAAVNHINYAKPVLSVPQNDQVGRINFPAKDRCLETRSPRICLNEKHTISSAQVSLKDKSFRWHTLNEHTETEAFNGPLRPERVPLGILCCGFIGTMNMILLWSSTSQHWLLWILGLSLGIAGLTSTARGRKSLLSALNGWKILLSRNTAYRSKLSQMSLGLHAYTHINIK